MQANESFFIGGMSNIYNATRVFLAVDLQIGSLYRFYAFHSGIDICLSGD
jgi:hypothetical protein